MKIENSNKWCRCDNCNNVAVEVVRMEFISINLCNECSEDLTNLLTTKREMV
jgi:hypothetical protein